MTAASISRLPTPPPPSSQPLRPFSRYSNLSESYVYPHTSIHPLTLHDSNKPRFNTATQPTPPPTPHSIFQHTSPSPSLATSLPHTYTVDLCLPRSSTPAAASVDPTYNAPLSAALAAASLDRFPLSVVSLNTVHRCRAAVEEDEEDGRRRKDEEVRVRCARQAARRRVAEEERRRRDEADRRIQQLPLHVRQLVYERWEQTATGDDTLLQTTALATTADEKASNDNSTTLQATTAAVDTHRTMHVHELDDTTLPNQTVATQRVDNTTAATQYSAGSGSSSSGSGSRLLMSRDEQRLFQLRVQQLARHKERLELHRIIAVRKEEAERREKHKQQRRDEQQQAAILQQQQQQQQRQDDTVRTTKPPPPALTHRSRFHARRQPASLPTTPHNQPHPPLLSWLYDELERRLHALGDVSVVPLCQCSRGGGKGGVGRGLVHLTGCVWSGGKEEAYAMKFLERVEDLERVRAEQLQADSEEVQRKMAEVELNSAPERQRTAAQASQHRQRFRAAQY